MSTKDGPVAIVRWDFTMNCITYMTLCGVVHVGSIYATQYILKVEYTKVVS